MTASQIIYETGRENKIMKKYEMPHWMYWGKHPENTMRPIVQEDTTWVYIHGEKVIIDNFFYALPDSTVFANPYVFYINDTCYIYAIKWQVATHYSLEAHKISCCIQELYS